MMNKILLFLGLLLVTITIRAEHSLTRENNMMRAGDEIIKQQVEYKDPGKAGENMLWDFSNLNILNDSYKLTYRKPTLRKDSIFLIFNNNLIFKETDPGELFVGTEHYTDYYYQLKDKKLFLLGHKNSVSLQHNKTPMLLLQFPLQYQVADGATYYSQALYSGSEQMNTSGGIRIEADASGIIILPNKDTIRQVLRIKTIQHVTEQPDSLKQSKGQEPYLAVIETHRWYAANYRYPIFETIKNTNPKDSIVRFTTAFFYPPVEQYFLPFDPDNQFEEKDDSYGSKNYGFDESKNFHYNTYPNPVLDVLTVEYHTQVPCSVEVSICSSIGKVLMKKMWTHGQEGTYMTRINMDKFGTGNYTLYVKTDTEEFSKVIIKQ